MRDRIDAQRWVIRHAFRKNETGSWHLEIWAKDNINLNVTGLLYQGDFEVTENLLSKGFIVRKEGKKNFLYHENGDMCYMIGMNLNMSESSGNYVCRVRDVMDKASKNNVNLLKMWIDGNPGWWFAPVLAGTSFEGVVSRKPLIHLPKEYHTNVFNSMNAKMVDEYLDCAKSKKINIELVIFDFLNFSDESNRLGWSYYSPYNLNHDNNAFNYNFYPTVVDNSMYYNSNIPNRTEIINPWDFFPEVPLSGSYKILEYQKFLLRYITSRWGYATNLLGWEIGKEININNNSLNQLDINNTIVNPFPQPIGMRNRIIEWHKECKRFIQETDASKHLITTSVVIKDKRPNEPTTYNNWKVTNMLTNEQFDIYSNLDYCVTHEYPGINAPCANETANDRFDEEDDNLFRASKVCQQELNMPHQIQEWGENFLCTNDKRHFKIDPFGFNLHNNTLCLAFSGDLGSPLSYDSYLSIQPHEQYNHFRGLGNFMKQFKDLGNITESDFFYTVSNPIEPQNHDGLKIAYMKTGDNGKILGWCQDARFSLPQLFWNSPPTFPGRKYLETLNPTFRPETNTQEFFKIPNTQTGLFKVEWFGTAEGIHLPAHDAFIRQLNGYLDIQFPQELHNSMYADAFFVITPVCKLIGILDYTINGQRKPNQNEPLEVKYAEDIKLEFSNLKNIVNIKMKVSRLELPAISTDFQAINESIILNDGELELNKYLYQLADKPGFSGKPFLEMINNHSETNYKIEISVDENLCPGQTAEITHAVNFIKIHSCSTATVLKVNNQESSSFTSPIEFEYGERINLDGTASTGEQGFRIIINRLDPITGGFTGTEYNRLYQNKCTTVINAHDVINQVTNGTLKYLPANSNDGFILYRVELVTFNSYTPASGCSNWNSVSHFIKVKCDATAHMALLNGVQNGDFKEYNYAEPIIADCSATTGETGYRIIIQECDENKSLFGQEFNLLKNNLQAGNNIDINTVINEITNDNLKYLPPGQSSPRFFKVKLAVFNGYSDNGCTDWDETQDYVKIVNCHATNEFSLNNNTTPNTFNTPYTFNFSEPIILDGRNSISETGYRIILVALDQNENIISEVANINYEGKISNIVDLNEWFNKHSTGKFIPIQFNEHNTIWKICLVLYNGYTDEGCDEWLINCMYFKLSNPNLSCGAKINGYTYPRPGIEPRIYPCASSNANLQLSESLYNYKVSIEELEKATWNANELAIFSRPNINERGNWTKLYSEEFYNKYSSPINLDELWYKKSGDPIDKSGNTTYQVTLSILPNSNGFFNTTLLRFYFDPGCYIIPRLSPQTQNLSLDEKDKNVCNNLLIVYPNPTHNKIRITNNIEGYLLFDHVQVINSFGQSVLKFEKANSKTDFDLSNLSTGVYFVNVVFEGRNQTFKVLKE